MNPATEREATKGGEHLKLIIVTLEKTIINLVFGNHGVVEASCKNTDELSGIMQ